MEFHAKRFDLIVEAVQLTLNGVVLRLDKTLIDLNIYDKSVLGKHVKTYILTGFRCEHQL